MSWTTKSKDCQHCGEDPHSASIRPAVMQLLGKWLCQYHLDTAEIVRGHLMRPIGSRREDERWIRENLRRVKQDAKNIQ